MNTRRQVIITGGLGFIGHHLTKSLIRRGYYPIIVDNLTNSSLSSLKGVDRLKYKFINADIRFYSILKRRLTSFKPKYIIHLAAIHFIPYCNQHPHEVLAVNVDGTKNVLKLLIDFNVNKLIFASSAAVYSPSKSKHFENEKLQPIDIYGKSKKLSEELILNFSKKNPNIKYNILRLFNIYGSNNLTPHLIPTILKKIKTKSIVTVGNIKTARDYIYIDDLINIFLLVLRSKSGFNNQIYNVGTGRNISGKYIIKTISKLYKKKIEIRIDDKLLRKKDCPQLIAGVDKIFHDFKFKPKYNFNSGIKQLCKN